MSVADDDAPERVGGEPSASGLSQVIVGARPDDPAALVLARARVASALFGGDKGLGRFRVLERLGSGGMGAVYAAYDPQLDRGVALKTVHVPERGHDAALAEAKALARLAHPNVVPVFDVGIEGDAVYIVMELVRGETLRSWVKDRSLDDVLDAYRQAGHALAAAHAAGLVHRDFKPDNAIVGVDGRVRVVDFGLACEASEARSAAGTPGYMAPEQAAGTVTPAADQYSFCVALTEALTDALGGEPPRWVAAILERGRAADPAARFASMAELVRALGRDPAKIRRRRIVVASTAVLVAAAFAVGRTSPAGEAAVCDGGDTELAATWHPGARAAALARIALLGEYGRELAPRLHEQLAEHARRWTAGRRDACVARRRGTPEPLFDRRMACLERSRAALSVVAELVSGSDAAGLDGLLVATRALPDPAACADTEALLGDVAAPPAVHASVVKQLRADLERARIEVAAGRLGEARARVDAIVLQARGLLHPPLLAEALLVAGRAAQANGDRSRAVPALTEALQLALASNAVDIAVEAWARRAWLRGTEGRFAEAYDGLEVVESLAARPRTAGFARALLHSSVGQVHNAASRRGDARAAFERALADARGVTGPGAVELVTIRRSLAIVADDPVERDGFLRDAEEAFAALLDANHPQTLETRWRRAQVSVVSLAEAAALMTDVCERYEIHVALTEARAACWAELAELRGERGEIEEAIAALARAGSSSDVPEVHEMMPYLPLWRGDAAAATREFQAALGALAPPRAGEPWYETEDRAQLRLGLGRAYLAARRTRDAHDVLQVAVDELAGVLRQQPSLIIERRLGRARAELAHTGVRTQASLEAAREAAAWLRAVGGSPEEIEQLERWISAADSPR